MRAGATMTEPTPISLANYERVQETLRDLFAWTSIGVIIDGLSDIARSRSCTEGKAWFDLSQALYAARIASGLPGYYRPPE